MVTEENTLAQHDIETITRYSVLNLMENMDKLFVHDVLTSIEGIVYMYSDDFLVWLRKELILGVCCSKLNHREFQDTVDVIDGELEARGPISNLDLTPIPDVLGGRFSDNPAIDDDLERILESDDGNHRTTSGSAKPNGIIAECNATYLTEMRQMWFFIPFMVLALCIFMCTGMLDDIMFIQDDALKAFALVGLALLLAWGVVCLLWIENLIWISAKRILKGKRT